MRGSLLRCLGSVERRYGTEKGQKPTKAKIEEHNAKDARDSPRPLHRQGQKPHTQKRRVSTCPMIWKSGGLKLPVGRHALGQGGAARFFPCLDRKSGSPGFARDDKF